MRHIHLVGDLFVSVFFLVAHKGKKLFFPCSELFEHLLLRPRRTGDPFLSLPLTETERERESWRRLEPGSEAHLEPEALLTRVVAGLNSISVDPSAVDRLLALARRPNVEAKASALPCYTNERYPFPSLHPYIRQAYDAFGPQRLMWATDCPFQVDPGHTYKGSIDLIQSGLDLAPIITHRLPYQEFERGFQAMLQGNTGKVVLDWTCCHRGRPQAQPSGTRGAAYELPQAHAHGRRRWRPR